MKYALAFLILLIPMLALADHYVVVGDNAPASDVVIAANFAASMKATTGTVYQSALESTVKSKMENPDGDTFVVIDGKKKQARIIGEDDPVARDYLMQQDFAVNTVIVQTDDSEDGRQVMSDDELEEKPEDNAVQEETVYVAPIKAEAPIVVDEPVVVEQIPTTPAIPEERPGLFARFFKWLADLF